MYISLDFSIIQMRYRHRRRSLESLLPYLIIICVGVIVVLLIQLYKVLTVEPTLSEVFFYVAEGEVEIHPWGIENWQKGYNGTRVLQGDTLKTLGNSKVVLKFYDGTVLRMDSNTELVFDEIKNDDDRNEFIFTLRNGDLWINKSSIDAKSTDLLINLANTQVKSLGTVFALKNSDETESVWVINGKVSVDVLKYEDDEKSVVDTIEVGVGQEAEFGSKEIKEFREYKRPYVLEALSDEFKKSTWYKWNIDEDITPSDFNGFLKEVKAT